MIEHQDCEKVASALATCSHGGNIYHISKVKWYAADQSITCMIILAGLPSHKLDCTEDYPSHGSLWLS